MSRSGLLPFEATGGGLLNRGTKYSGYVEVEEVDRVGNLSKVKVLKVTGARWDQLKDVFSEWVPSTHVIWRSPEAPTSDNGVEGQTGPLPKDAQ